MKKTIAAIFIICLLGISSLHADYSNLNKAWENYTPPDYYIGSLESKASLSESAARSDNTVDAIFSQIKMLKQLHEKSIQPRHQILFLPDQDTETVKRLTEIAADPEKVARLVKDRLSLPEIQIIAGIRNPSILEAQKRVRADLESFNQVLDLDESLKQYSAFTEDLNTRVGPVKMNQSISQKFPFPGLTSLKARVIDQQVAVSVEKMRIEQKNTITDTRQAYWNIIFIDQSIQITAETIDAFARLQDVATILYKSGRTSFQDIIKINIKMAELKEDLVTFSSSRKNIEAQLCELLSIPEGTRMGAVVISGPDKKIPEPDSLFSLARQNRQELKVIRHQISRVENMIEMAESMIQEPFTLGFSRYEDEAANMVGNQAGKASFPEKTMAAMKNGSPLKPWYGIDDPWLNQTRQTLSSLKQNLVKQENATDRMVREAWFNVDKNRRELALYTNKILSLSKSALDVSTREYEAGSIPFSQAIGSYTSWLTVNLTIARKKTDLGNAIANLERLIGISFQ